MPVTNGCVQSLLSLLVCRTAWVSSDQGHCPVAEMGSCPGLPEFRAFHCASASTTFLNFPEYLSDIFADFGFLKMNDKL
jgi:hypothetical protein